MLDYDAIGKAIQAVDFDHVFTIAADGTVSDGPANVYPPTVEHDETRDITMTRTSYDRGEWEALTGMTGQYGYHGAVMHPSEFIGAGIAKRLTEEPGVYAVVTVGAGECTCTPHKTRMSGFGTALYCETEQNAYCNFECECGSDEPIGWAILRYTD